MILEGDEIDEATLERLMRGQHWIALRIRRVVASAYGLNVEAIVGKDRTADIAEARQVCAYIMRQGLYEPVMRCEARGNVEVMVFRKRRYPWAKIGALLQQDHSTAIHNHHVIARKRREDPAVAYMLTTIIAQHQKPPTATEITGQRAQAC